MRKKWAGYTVVFSLCMSLLAPAGHSRAAEGSVRVKLPDFAVNLNGHTMENQYREYPLLVYRDITYFPMTWYDTRLLGLEANWSPDDGLNIKQSRVTSSYVPYKSEHRNAAVYAARGANVDAENAVITSTSRTIRKSKHLNVPSVTSEPARAS